MNFKLIWGTLKQILNEYSDDKVPKLAAALSYYTAFSIAPLLLISVALAGAIFGNEAAQGRIVSELQSLIGHDGAEFIQTAMQNTSKTEAGLMATLISVGTLVITATAAFIELQDSLNIIWKVRSKPGRALMQFIRNRLLSLGLIVGVGFLLLVSLVISAALTALGNYLEGIMNVPKVLLEVINLAVSLGVIFVLFSLVFMMLPDVKVKWRDVRIGALVTTILFIIGKYLVALYLGSGSIGSTFGAAGSLAILLVWVYYSSQIVFLGAEFTYVYTDKFGSGVVPNEHAERIEVHPLSKENQEKPKERRVAKAS